MKRVEANLWRQEGGTKPRTLVAVADARGTWLDTCVFNPRIIGITYLVQLNRTIIGLHAQSRV